MSSVSRVSSVIDEVVSKLSKLFVSSEMTVEMAAIDCAAEWFFPSRIYLSYLTIAIAVTRRSTFQIPLWLSDKPSNIYQRLPEIQYFITYTMWFLVQLGFRPVITALPWLRKQRKIISQACGCMTA